MEPSLINSETNILATIIGALVWIGIAALLGRWGKNRRIGFWPAFITGLVFWPISIILILVLGPKEEEMNSVEEAVQQYQTAKLNNDQAILAQFESITSNMSINEKLEQLKQMKADGLLNELDYNRMKTNLLIGR